MTNREVPRVLLRVIVAGLLVLAGCAGRPEGVLVPSGEAAQRPTAAAEQVRSAAVQSSACRRMHQCAAASVMASSGLGLRRSWFIAAPGFAHSTLAGGLPRTEVMASDYQLCRFSSDW